MNTTTNFWIPTKLLLISLLVNFVFANPASAQLKLDPVRAVTKCSSKNSVVTYGSDCLGSNDELIINARHESSLPSSPLVRLEIYSARYGIYFSYDKGEETKLIGFQGFSNNYGTYPLGADLQGKQMRVNQRYPVARVYMRGFTDFDVECNNNWETMYQPPEAYGAYFDRITKLVEGIKFDQRIAAYLEQYLFSISELNAACELLGNGESITQIVKHRSDQKREIIELERKLTDLRQLYFQRQKKIQELERRVFFAMNQVVECRLDKEASAKRYSENINKYIERSAARIKATKANCSGQTELKQRIQKSDFEETLAGMDVQHHRVKEDLERQLLKLSQEKKILKLRQKKRLKA